MIRQFDAEQDPSRAWMPCPREGAYCSRLADRWSLSIVNAKLRHLYSERVGFVIRPLPEVDRSLLCAYPDECARRARAQASTRPVPVREVPRD